MNVREAFPNLEKFTRFKRGHHPRRVFNKVPSFEQLVNKLASTVIDDHTKVSIDSYNRPVEMKRYILRSNRNKFGYLCTKTSNFKLHLCASYDDLQKVANVMEQSVAWYDSFNELVDYVSKHCSSPSYVKHLKNIKV